VEQLQQQQNLIVKENQLIQACERLDLQWMWTKKNMWNISNLQKNASVSLKKC
jgi:hypothetical protein